MKDRLEFLSRRFQILFEALSQQFSIDSILVWPSILSSTEEIQGFENRGQVEKERRYGSSTWKTRLSSLKQTKELNKLVTWLNLLRGMLPIVFVYFSNAASEFRRRSSTLIKNCPKRTKTASFFASRARIILMRF